jgi:2'-5' RNA ligase
MDQKRYFIGISLPDAISEQISALQSNLFDAQGMQPPLVPHITLLHPNVLMTLSPMYFLPKVKEIAASLLPIEVHLTQVDSFGKRVQYIVVESPALIKLQESLVELLPEKIRAQYYVGREFTPHVTLAQAKPRQQLQAATFQQFTDVITPLLPYKFLATELTQFTWEGPRKYKINPIT